MAKYSVSEFEGDFPIERSKIWDRSFDDLSVAKRFAREFFAKQKKKPNDYHVDVYNSVSGHCFLKVARRV